MMPDIATISHPPPSWAEMLRRTARHAGPNAVRPPSTSTTAPSTTAPTSTPSTAALTTAPTTPMMRRDAHQTMGHRPLPSRRAGGLPATRRLLPPLSHVAVSPAQHITTMTAQTEARATAHVPSGLDTDSLMEPQGPSQTGEPSVSDAPMEQVEDMRARPAIPGAQDEAGLARGHFFQLINHLRTQRDPHQRAALVDSSHVYHELRGLHVLPCPWDVGRCMTERDPGPLGTMMRTWRSVAVRKGRRPDHVVPQPFRGSKMPHGKGSL